MTLTCLVKIREIQAENGGAVRTAGVRDAFVVRFSRDHAVYYNNSWYFWYDHLFTYQNHIRFLPK